MKSSPDFQTGSILLLTATLVCIGLAIAVIAPIIDSPLSGSTVAETVPRSKSDTGSQQQGHPLGEFYPPIAQAKHELKRSQEMTRSTVFQASQLSEPFVSAVPTELTATDDTAPLQEVSTAPFSKPPGATVATSFPQGTVYAPITIHQPAAGHSPTGREIADVAERIERLVTERERLAASVEIEKQRQTEIARQTRRKQATELQQQQIARLEHELKLLNQSMANLQTETSSQLSRLTEQNSQIDVASQALNAYREALKIATTESARSADASRLRTAQAVPEQTRSLEKRRQTQDDAGRVNIPILPPMPTHQPSSPPESEPVDEAPQTAEKTPKRLRVSSPVRTFEAPASEPTRQFLPLPTTSKTPIKPPKQTTTKPKKNKPSVSYSPAHQQMKFVPLEAPTIRDFHIKPVKNSIPSSTSRSTSTRQHQRASIPQRFRTEVVPDLNVGFEHTYQFESTPIVEDASEADTTEIIISTINLDVPQKTLPDRIPRLEQPVPFQFEAIEFPDLSIVNQNESKIVKQLRHLPQQQPRLAAGNDLNRQLKPVVTASLRPEPKQQKAVKQPITVDPPKPPTWIEKVSGALNPLGSTASPRSTNTNQSSAKPNLGGRGQNRHVQRQTTKKRRLRLSGASSDKQVDVIDNSVIEKPSMLQRMSQKFQSRDSKTK